jgi:hypothetical protein
MKPVSVTVIWSESYFFPDEGRVYAFEKFESRAKRAAYNVEKGYDKTKIIVTFDDGDTYLCRLDLARDEDQNFQHYVEGFLNSPMSDDFPEQAQFFERIEWP